MQSKNTIAIVHTMAGMRGMHELYVCYLEQTLDAHCSIVNVTSSAYTEAM